MPLPAHLFFCVCLTVQTLLHLRILHLPTYPPINVVVYLSRHLCICSIRLAIHPHSSTYLCIDTPMLSLSSFSLCMFAFVSPSFLLVLCLPCLLFSLLSSLLSPFLSSLLSSFLSPAFPPFFSLYPVRIKLTNATSASAVVVPTDNQTCWDAPGVC